MIVSNIFYTMAFVFFVIQIQAKNYCSSDAEIRRQKRLSQCVASVESIRENGPYHIGADAENFLTSDDDLPNWFDPEFAAIGQKFALQNAFPVYYFTYLLILFSVIDPNTRKVFINNGHMSSPQDTANRFMTNNLQIYLWFKEDIRGNRTNLFQSLNSVRAKHVTAAHKANLNATRLENNPSIPEPPPGQNPKNIDLRIWNAFEEDLNSSAKVKRIMAAANLKKRTRTPGENDKKYLMNQFGMSVVLFRQVGLPLWLPEESMLSGATDTELEAYLHLWAFIGKSVGVQDEFNICFQPDIKTAREYMKNFFYENMVPLLFKLDYEAKVLFEYLYKGINNIFFRAKTPLLLEMNNLGDLFLLRFLEDILKIPAPHMRSVLTPIEKATNAVIQRIIRGHKGKRRKTAQAIGSVFIPQLLKIVSRVNLGLDSSIASEIAEKAYV